MRAASHGIVVVVVVVVVVKINALGADQPSTFSFQTSFVFFIISKWHIYSESSVGLDRDHETLFCFTVAWVCCEKDDQRSVT